MKMFPPNLGRRSIKELLNRLIHERILLSIFRNPMWLVKRYGRMQGEMLFNKLNDPAENENLITLQQEVLVTMQDQLTVWMENCQKLAAKHVSGYEMDEEEDELMRKHLQALGYLD